MASNPLEDEVWKQIREAYKLVDSAEVDEVEVDSPNHNIRVFRGGDEDLFGQTIYIKVVM
jgi:hypothetical protein